jgi:NADH-quinone oxidoreductase subunit L
MLSEFWQSSTIRFIPIAPLAVAVLHGVLIGLLRRPLSRQWVAYSSIGATAASIFFMLIALAELLSGDGAPLIDRIGSWIGLGVGSASFNVDLAFRLDALSVVMGLAIAGLGVIVQVYAVGFLAQDAREDRGFERFFCFQGLLIGLMLMLVLADNVVLLLLGWMGVGLATYLLILFWYGDADHVGGGTRALVANLIGDAALLVGALLLYWVFAEGGAPTLSFGAIQANLPILEKATITLPPLFGGGPLPVASLLGFCFLIAAVARSAQLPLSGWLPESSHAPIPALALVQAATTVAAGAYLLARFSFLYVIAPEASAVLTWCGALTALVGAAIACAQTDVRRVLAWSTISQLGFVFTSLGIGAPTYAIYHLIGHAYAKTLLFMAAGIVVIAVGHKYEMQEMRGIGSRLRLTRRCWWVGVLSLIGAPPFVGFFTTVLVLGAVSGATETPGYVLLQFVMFSSLGLTAFYGVRFVYFALYGKSKIPTDVRQEIHDPERQLLWPLIFAALLCVVGSLAGWPQSWGDLLEIPDSNSIHFFLQSALVTNPGLITNPELELRAIRFTALMLVLGATPAVYFYLFSEQGIQAIVERVPSLARLLKRGLLLGEAYERVVLVPLSRFTRVFVDDFLERRIVERGLIGASAKIVKGVAEGVIKYSQPGFVSAHLFLAAVGAAFVVVFVVTSSSA